MAGYFRRWPQTKKVWSDLRKGTNEAVKYLHRYRYVKAFGTTTGNKGKK